MTHTIKRLTSRGDKCDECYGTRIHKAKYRRIVPRPLMDGSPEVEQVHQYLCGVHRSNTWIPQYITTWYNGLPLDRRPGGEGGLFALVGMMNPIPKEA